SGAASRQPGPATRVTDALVAFAESRGIDPAVVLDSPQTLRSLGADGRVHEVRLTAAQAIRRIAKRFPVFERNVESGAAGPFELNVGDVGHAYLRVDFGGGATVAYDVTESQAVPATPGPVGLAPPGAPGFIEWGGPLTQVKGKTWTVGGHLVGSSPVGSNIDTAESGPYLPTDSGVVSDNSVDFLGHIGVLEQVEVCFPFFGCVASFGAFAGDGVTLFDAEDGYEFPVVP
ncbi:MAG: hypothetical protein ACRDJM_00830, partial [Actinomycetota bacterium]